jgi:hypothetical protein
MFGGDRSVFCITHSFAPSFTLRNIKSIDAYKCIVKDCCAEERGLTVIAVYKGKQSLVV